MTDRRPWKCPVTLPGKSLPCGRIEQDVAWARVHLLEHIAQGFRVEVTATEFVKGLTADVIERELHRRRLLAVPI